MNNIYDDEIIDDLQLDGLKIIQKKNGFKFGIDAVILSDFAKSAKSKATLDLCTGNGIVPLLLSAKTNTQKICGLEIQKDICDMAKRSVSLNSLSGRIELDTLFGGSDIIHILKQILIPAGSQTYRLREDGCQSVAGRSMQGLVPPVVLLDAEFRNRRTLVIHQCYLLFKRKAAN